MTCIAGVCFDFVVAREEGCWWWRMRGLGDVLAELGGIGIHFDLLGYMILCDLPLTIKPSWANLVPPKTNLASSVSGSRHQPPLCYSARLLMFARNFDASSGLV